MFDALWCQLTRRQRQRASAWCCLLVDQSTSNWAPRFQSAAAAVTTNPYLASALPPFAFIVDYCILSTLSTSVHYCKLLSTIIYYCCMLVYYYGDHQPPPPRHPSALPMLAFIVNYSLLLYTILRTHTIVFYCGDQPPPPRLPCALPPLAFIIPSSLVLPASLIKIYSITSLAAFWLDVWIAMLVQCLLLPEKRKHVSHSNWSYLRHTRSCHQTKLSSAPSQLVSAGPSFVCPSLPPPPCPTKRSIWHQYSSPLSEHLIRKIWLSGLKGVFQTPNLGCCRAKRSNKVFSMECRQIIRIFFTEGCHFIRSNVIIV